MPRSYTPDEKISRNRRDSLVGTYNFPGRDSYHNIVLMFRNYDHKNLNGLVRRDTIDNVETRLQKSIVLPLPTNLQDTFTVAFNSFELGLSGAVALDAMSASGRQAVLDSLTNRDTVGEGVGGIVSTLQTAASFAGQNLLDEIGIAGVSSAFDLSRAAAQNNHVTLRFEGVNLKTHTFNWSLSPRNREEADTLKNIIQYVRRQILPEYQTAGVQEGNAQGSALDRALLSYPSVVDIFFIGANQEYFYYFKPCMIQSFSTDFAPNGLAMNVGGKPSVVNLSMQLSEAKIHTRDDYPMDDEG